MLCPIEEEAMTRALQRLCGRTVYLHMEVTPGGFLRNLAARMDEAVLRRDGEAYRLALRCGGQGWVVVEGLTHMALGEGEPLQLCTLVEEDRLSRVIVIAEEALAA